MQIQMKQWVPMVNRGINQVCGQNLCERPGTCLWVAQTHVAPLLKTQTNSSVYPPSRKWPRPEALVLGECWPDRREESHGWGGCRSSCGVRRPVLWWRIRRPVPRCRIRRPVLWWRIRRPLTLPGDISCSGCRFCGFLLWFFIKSAFRMASCRLRHL